MPKIKTSYEKAAGKLISSIQKEWKKQIGETDAADFTEDVMDRAHDLLQARDAEGARKVLKGLSVNQYIGEVWLKAHPDVVEKVEDLEKLV